VKAVNFSYFRNVLFLIFILLPYSVFGQQSAIRLAVDFQEGRISRHDYAVNRGYAMFAPELLPAEYRFPDDLHEKCGLEVIHLLRSEYDNLTPDERSFFQKYLFRPTFLPQNYISQGELFKIHYTTDPLSNDVVPLEDVNSNGIPDFVEEAATAFEYSHNYYVDVLGYKPPPVDGVDGDEYDVYMWNLGGGNYGWTAYETDQPGTPWLDPSSYISIHNNFQGGLFYTNGLDALRVTSAHEYHHAIQFGYIWRVSDIYFYEMTAVWFEDVMYDEVNDYLQYLPLLFGNNTDPQNPVSNTFTKPFNTGGTMFQYGMCIWNHFISERYGAEPIRRVWEQMHLRPAILNIEKVINEELPTDFETELQTFYAWNYFAGSRADTINYYSEGHLFPDLVFNKTLDDPNDTTFVITNKELSSRYIAVKRQQKAIFNIMLEGEVGDNGLWRATAALSDNISPPNLQPIPFLDDISGNVTITSYGNNPQLVIIPTMTAKTTQSGYYPLTVSLKFSGLIPITENKLLPTIPSPADFSKVQKVKIPFVLIESQEIEITIYSSSGILVKSFPKKYYTRGLHENDIVWDGRDNNNKLVPSGIYIYIIKGENFTHWEKMAVIR